MDNPVAGPRIRLLPNARETLLVKLFVPENVLLSLRRVEEANVHVEVE
jgi:hypothetical protein